MRILDIALVVVLFFQSLPAQGESTRDSDGTERESKPWEILQQATDPEIIAIRQVLEVLVNEQRPEGRLIGTEARRIDPMEASRERALEDRVRRLESELVRLRAHVDRLR